MHVLPRNGRIGMLRGRRVAGILALALALASPVMIAGFVVASLGVTSTLLLLRR